MIWSLAPKQTLSGVKTVDIVSYCAASIFRIGPNAFNFCDTVDERENHKQTNGRSTLQKKGESKEERRNWHSKRISLKKKVYYMKQEWAINGKKLKNDFFIEKTNAKTLNAFFSKLSFSKRCTRFLEF